MTNRERWARYSELAALSAEAMATSYALQAEAAKALGDSSAEHIEAMRDLARSCRQRAADHRAHADYDTMIAEAA